MAGHQNAPRGSPGGLDRRGRWLRMRQAAGFVLPWRPGDPAALARQAHRVLGRGASGVSDCGLAGSAAFCSLLCCLGFWEGGPSFAAGSQESDATIVQPCFSFPDALPLGFCTRHRIVYTLKTSILNFLFPSPPLMSSFKGRIWGRLSLGEGSSPLFTPRGSRRPASALPL